MSFAFGLFHLNLVHLIKPICNDILMPVGKAEQIIIVLVPNHKRRIDDITAAAFAIDFPMFFIVIEILKRNLLVLVYGAVYRVHVVYKRTVPFPSPLQRNDML